MEPALLDLVYQHIKKSRKFEKWGKIEEAYNQLEMIENTLDNPKLKFVETICKKLSILSN